MKPSSALLSILLPLAALAETPPLAVSPDGRTLEAGGEPFFWLGDTGWLMLSRLDRIETEHYLRTRKMQKAVFVESLENTGEATFDPPGDVAPGNDWVLFLEANGRL